MPLINFLLILLSLSFGAASTSSYSVSLDVCQIITVVESVTILSTYIPKNTEISIDNIKTITITNAPTTISSIITISSTLIPHTQPSPSADNAPQWTTSTVYRAHIYTITSCGHTVTDCPGLIGQVTTEATIDYTTVYPLISSTEAPDTKYYTTVTTDKFITVCPTPTTFTHGTQTYTVTDSSTITITDCPCTFTHSFTPSASSTQSTTSTHITGLASTIASLEMENSLSDIPRSIGDVTTSALSSGSNLETSTTSSTVPSASSLSPSASFIVGIATPGTLPKKRQDTKSYLLADGRLTTDCSKAMHLIISEGRLLDATNPTSYYSVPPHTEFENFLPNSPGAIPNGSVSTGFSISLAQELVWNPGFDSIVDVLFALNYQGIILAVFDAFLPPDSILVDLEVISLSDGDCPGLPSATTSLQPSLATLKPLFGTSIPSLKSSKLSLGTSISSLGTPIPSESQGTAIQSSSISIPSSSVMWTNSSGPAQPTSHAPVTGISTSAYLFTTSLPKPTATSNTPNSTIYSARNSSLSSVTSGEAPSLAAVTLSSIAFLASSESPSTFVSPSSIEINSRSSANSSGFAAESLTTTPTSVSLSYRFTNSSQMISTTSSSVKATVTSEAQSVIAAERSIFGVESFSTPSVSTISAYSNSSLISFTTPLPVVAISSQAPLTSSSIFLNSGSVPFVPVTTSIGNSLEPGTIIPSILLISSSLVANRSGILSIPSLAQPTSEGLSSSSSSVLLSSSVYTPFESSSNTPIVYSSSPIFLSTSGAATTSTASSSISSSSSIETGSFVEASTLSSGTLKTDSKSSSITEGSSSGIEVGSFGTPLSTIPSSTSESDISTSAVDFSEGILLSTSQPLVNSTVSSSTLFTLPTSLQSPPKSSSASDTSKLNTSMSSQESASSTTELPTSTIQSSADEISMQPSSIFSKQPSGTSSLAEPSTFIVSSLLSFQSEVSIDSAAPSGESSTHSITSFPSSSVTTTNTSSYMVILTATSVQESIATTSTSAASAEISSLITLTSSSAAATISEFSTSTQSSIASSTLSSSCSSGIAPTPTCGANQVLANPSFGDFDCDGPLASPWSSSGHTNKRSSGVSRIGDESSPIYTGGYAPIYVDPNVNPSDIFQSVSCLDMTMMYSASFSLEIVSFEDEDMQASSGPSCVLNVSLGNTQMTTIPVDNLPKTGYNYVTTYSVVPLQPSEDFRVVLSCSKDRQATCLVHVTDFTLGPRGLAPIQTTSSSSSVPSSVTERTVAAVSTPISVASSNSTSATTTSSASLCLKTSVIVNGDFEDFSTDIDPWTLTNAVQPLIERGPGFPYSGNNTLLIYKSDLNATEVWSLNQTVQTCPETPYFFSFYARANGDNSTLDTACPISVCFDDDCQLITTLYNYDFGYSQYYRLFNGFPYATNLTVSIESDACGQYVFIDDVTFDSTTPGYTPPPPANVVDCSGGTTRENCTNIIGCYWSTYYEHCYDYSYGS